MVHSKEGPILAGAEVDAYLFVAKRKVEHLRTTIPQSDETLLSLGDDAFERLLMLTMAL